VQVGVAVALVVVVALFTVPLPHSFSATLGFTRPGLGPVTIAGTTFFAFPNGCRVVGSFSDEPAGTSGLGLEIYDSDFAPVYSSNSSSNSSNAAFSFTASNSPYTFEVIFLTTGIPNASQIDISGHYSSPFLFF